MLSRPLGRLSAPMLRHSAAAFAPIAPAKLNTSLSVPLRAVLTQHTAGVSSSASLHYSGRDLHALVYGRSKKTVHELGEDYGADSYDESHNHPWLWLISFASTGVMAYMLWNNHLPDDKERIHRDFYAWLRSLGIPVAHAEAAQVAVQKATAAVNAGAMPVQTQTPPAADPAKPHGLPTSPAAAAAAAAAIAAVNATPIADDDPPVAGFLRRFLAFMADSVVVNSFLFLLRESMARLRPNDDSLQTVGGAVCANALATLCFDLFFMLYCDGKTPGKWLTSLRTVKQDFTEMDAVTAIKGATARTALSLAPPLEFVPFLCQSTHAHRYSDGVPCFVRWHDQRIQRAVSALSRCRKDGQLVHNWVADTIVVHESAELKYEDE